MPYGTVQTETRDYLRRRAVQAGIDPNSLDLESEAEDSLTLDITFEGALDESFAIGTAHDADIFDWVVSLMRETYPNKDWWVCLYISHPDGDSTVIEEIRNEEN